MPFILFGIDIFTGILTRKIFNQFSDALSQEVLRALKYFNKYTFIQ